MAPTTPIFTVTGSADVVSWLPAASSAVSLAAVVPALLLLLLFAASLLPHPVNTVARDVSVSASAIIFFSFMFFPPAMCTNCRFNLCTHYA